MILYSSKPDVIVSTRVSLVALPSVSRHHDISTRRPIMFLVVVALLIVGCASQPPQSKQQPLSPDVDHLSTPDEPTDDHDVLMGPPRLLSSPNSEAEVDQEEVQSALPRLITVEKQRDALGVIQVWFKAGPLQEERLERGASSLLSHLILDSAKSGDHLSRQLRRQGAQVRSWTTLNRYVIEMRVAPAFIPQALALLGASLRRDLSEEEVTHAIKMRLAHGADAAPAQSGWLHRRVTLRLLAQTLHQRHRHERLMLSGEEGTDVIKALSYQQVKRFFQRVTHPKNNTVVVVGAESQESIREALRSHWTYTADPRPQSFEDEVASAERGDAQEVDGGLDEVNALDVSHESPQHTKHTHTPTPSLSVEELKTQRALISMIFPTSQISPEEASYLDLLSLVLVGDQRGLIHRACERAGVELKSIRMTPFIHDGHSALILTAQVDRLQVNEAWEAMLRVIGQVARRPISPRALEAAKSQLERETTLVSEPLSGQALRLGFFSSQWSEGDALQRYGRAAYRVRVSALFSFARKLFLNPRAQAIIASAPPSELSVKIWREQLAERLRLEMTESPKRALQGFSAHGAEITMLFSPTKGSGVTSLYATIPIPRRRLSSKTLALGHWAAAHLSQSQPQEPRFQAHFHDDFLTISSTFPSAHIDAAISWLVKSIRQAPLTSEPLWSSDTLERSRRSALTRLSLTARHSEDSTSLLDRRIRSAFGEGVLPLAPRRRQRLAAASSSELMSWFRQNIQSQPISLIVSGDVSERRLRQAFAPLKRPEALSPTRALHESPYAVSPLHLKQCRALFLSSDAPESLIVSSFPIPPEVSLEQLRILEVALTTPTLSHPLPERARAQIVRSPLGALRSTLSIRVHTPSVALKATQEALQERIKRLQSDVLTPDQWEKLKQITLTLETREVEVSARYAEWLAYSWFSGWQSEKSRGFAAWRQNLAKMTPIQLREAAQAVLKEQSLRLVIISPPEHHKDIASECKHVAP